MIKNWHIRIFGLVQGVSFRWFAREEAYKSQIHGYARNLAGGSVEIEAEGQEENLEKFAAALHKGPEFARVDKVEIEEGEVQNYENFKIEK